MDKEQTQTQDISATLTNGEVAYNAYCNLSGWKSLASGADLPPFSGTKPEIRDAWEAAAQAVLDHNTPVTNEAKAA